MDKVGKARRFGHIQRRNTYYGDTRMQKSGRPLERSIGRPKRRFMNVMQEDI